MGSCRLTRIESQNSAFLRIISININHWIKAIGLEECELDVRREEERKKKLDFDCVVWISVRSKSSNRKKNNWHQEKRSVSQSFFFLFQQNVWHPLNNECLSLLEQQQLFNIFCYFSAIMKAFSLHENTLEHEYFIKLEKWEQEIRNWE